LLVAALNECRGIFRDLEAPTFEADDCIGTEAKAALERGVFVVVMSDDKDMAQLVGKDCRWLAGGKLYDEAAVRAKFGVPPDRMRHLLSWTGDAVDGLPGVPGYGPKKAIAKALAGKIGNQLTYDLTELADVPCFS
jgi:5'-3' exonuclease